MDLNNKLFDWIGGKKWLSSKLKSKFEYILENNKDIKYYAEPFCGSLGSLLDSVETLKKNNIEKIYLNDINKTVVNTFNFVKKDPIAIYEYFKEIEDRHLSLIPERAFKLNKTRDKIELKVLMNESKDFYNEKRNRFNQIKNENTLESCATFLFLMARAFNGIYRENSSGNFNSPYGWTNKKLNFENRKKTILEFSNFFNKMNVEFSSMSYEEFLNNFENKENTLFYFDPPYLNEEIKENNYNKDSFNKDQQIKLMNTIKKLNYIVYSNHNIKIIRDFFENDYEIEVVYRKNNMSSKNENRSNDVPEILVSSK
jgi:DNA adenine methylase